MFTNTLIGLQDVPSGVEAAHLARRLTTAGGKLGLVRVHGGYHVVASSVNSSRADAEQRVAASELNRVAQLTGITEGFAIGATSVGDGFNTAINQRRADLLVLSAAQVLNPMETLVAALGQLNAAVAVTGASGSQSNEPPRSIGVAYDNSVESERALTVARRLAGFHGASLTGYGVSAARSGLGGNQAAARAAEELIAFSNSVDLLVISPRPSRPLRRLLGPGTIEEIIAASSSPVLIVPAHAVLPAVTPGPASEEWVEAADSAVAYR